MASPSASPPRKPVSTPITVMPICTVDRNASGFSDSSSALAARLEVPASCFSRLLREVMTDISDMAKKPFNRTSAKTIRIISNTGIVPGW
ncbi:hypothetical protein D3C72_1737920 [compost metagenome]